MFCRFIFVTFVSLASAAIQSAFTCSICRSLYAGQFLIMRATIRPTSSTVMWSSSAYFSSDRTTTCAVSSLVICRLLLLFLLIVICLVHLFLVVLFLLRHSRRASLQICGSTHAAKAPSSAPSQNDALIRIAPRVLIFVQRFLIATSICRRFFAPNFVPEGTLSIQLQTANTLCVCVRALNSCHAPFVLCFYSLSPV